MSSKKNQIKSSINKIKILMTSIILHFRLIAFFDNPKIKLRRASPFVEEVGLVLIALFFFVILYSVFSEIIDNFVNIIDDILQNLSL